jgi:tRNA(Ile)-lysidine synthase
VNITENKIELSILEFLKKYKITKENSILIAYSGGPDSSALLWAFSILQKSIGFNLSALYVNHGIRPCSEIENEISIIKEFVIKCNVELHIVNIEYGLIEKNAKRQGQSIEELAREYRYEAIEETMGSINADYVALGHTLDDQLETLIMRFFQGSGVHGLEGIPEIRGSIIRPIISIQKDSLLEYLDIKNLSYSTDKTNNHSIYLRNKIRLELIPVIADIFPGFKGSLVNFAKKAKYVNAVLDKNTNNKYLNKTDNGIPWFSWNVFKDLSAYEQSELIYKSWDLWKEKPFKRLPFKFITNLIGINSNSLSKILLEGYDCQLIKDKDRIFWKRVVVVSIKKSYLRVVTIGDNEIYPGFNVRCFNNFELMKDRIWFNRDKIQFPLIIRSRNAGDFLGLSEGKKTIKKILNEWCVKPSDRWKIPIIEDRTGIIAVLGRPFGHRNRIADKYKNYSVDKDLIVISAGYMENLK